MRLRTPGVVSNHSTCEYYSYSTLVIRVLQQKQTAKRRDSASSLSLRTYQFKKKRREHSSFRYKKQFIHRGVKTSISRPGITQRYSQHVPASTIHGRQNTEANILLKICMGQSGLRKQRLGVSFRDSGHKNDGAKEVWKMKTSVRQKSTSRLITSANQLQRSILIDDVFKALNQYTTSLCCAYFPLQNQYKESLALTQ